MAQQNTWFENTLNREEKIAPQSKTTMILAVVFLGMLGVHRWMMGYKYWWLMPITLGGFGIWALVDLIQIISGRLKMADGKDLVR